MLTDFEKAITELQLGNYSEGMVILQNLLKEEPDDIDILYNLGICYSEMGFLTKSIEKLEKCVQLSPGFANALVALGFSYYQQGSDEKAIDLLKQALAIEPNNVYALKNLGALYNRIGEPDQAIETLNKAEQQKPGLPEILLGFGQAYELKNDYSQATHYFKKVLNSEASGLVLGKATEGLNRIAMEDLKESGQNKAAETIMGCLSAIEIYAESSSEKVREIAFEAAMLGTEGLSINDPEAKYSLKTLQGEFTGLQLLCLMFVGFKMIEPKMPPVADLESEYQQALKIYRRRLDEH